MIGGPAQHDAINVIQVLQRLIQVTNSAVYTNENIWKFAFETIHAIIVQRWNIPVFLGRQTIQPGLAGMHPDSVSAGVTHRARQGRQCNLRILIVNADAAFDRNIRNRFHHHHASSDQFRFAHQAGAERT